MDKIEILDVKIDIISKQQVLDKIKDLLNSNENGKQLCTTNPEFILAAQKDNEFKNIINNSWLSVADGYGIRLAAKYLMLAEASRRGNKSKLLNCYIVKLLKNFLIGMKIAYWGIVRSNKLNVIREVITGSDLVLDIVKESRIKNQELRIFLLGGYSDTPRLTAERLQTHVETLHTTSLQIDYSIFEIENIIEKINNFKPDILFVALNHPRAQKWINKNLSKMSSVKLAMGVGGAFDYISGKIKRAPIGWRHSFEWLYRLILQPKRWKRIFNAWPKFPWKVFINSINNKDNLIPIVNEQDEMINYKQRDEITHDDIYKISALWITDSKDRILLAQRSINKKHDPGKWGPAVAGTVEKGESYESNIIKEVEEELGIKNCKLTKGPKERVIDKWSYFAQWYTLKIDKNIEEFTIQKDEIEQIKWFKPNEFIERLEKNPGDFLNTMPRLKELFLKNII